MSSMTSLTSKSRFLKEKSSNKSKRNVRPELLPDHEFIKLLKDMVIQFTKDCNIDAKNDMRLIKKLEEFPLSKLDPDILKSQSIIYENEDYVESEAENARETEVKKCIKRLQLNKTEGDNDMVRFLKKKTNKFLKQLKKGENMANNYLQLRNEILESPYVQNPEMFAVPELPNKGKQLNDIFDEYLKMSKFDLNKCSPSETSQNKSEENKEKRSNTSRKLRNKSIGLELDSELETWEDLQRLKSVSELLDNVTEFEDEEDSHSYQSSLDLTKYSLGPHMLNEDSIDNPMDYILNNSNPDLIPAKYRSNSLLGSRASKSGKSGRFRKTRN